MDEARFADCPLLPNAMEELHATREQGVGSDSL